MRSLEQGGLPIGWVLTRGADLIASGHNQRFQHRDPIAHGKIDYLRKAGAKVRCDALYVALAMHDVRGRDRAVQDRPRGHQRHPDFGRQRGLPEKPWR